MSLFAVDGPRRGIASAFRLPKARQALLTTLAILGLVAGVSAQPATPAPVPAATASPTAAATPRSSSTPSGAETAPQATPSTSPAPAATPVLVAPAASASPSAVPTPLPAAAPVAAEFATPQASLQAFLLLMRQGGPLKPIPLAQARSHMDLSAIPTVVREERGVQLSQQLVKIIESAQIDTSALNFDPDAQRVVVYKQPDGKGISLEKQVDGRWLISADTVANIPEMYGVLTDKGRIQVRRIAALDFVFLGLSGEQWVGLAVLPLIAYLLGKLFVLFARAALGRLQRREELEQVVKRPSVLKPIGRVVTALAIWAGLPGLALPDGLLVVLIVLVKVSVTTTLIQSLLGLTDAASDYAVALSTRRTARFDNMLIPLVRRTLKTVIVILGLLFLAQNLNIQVWSLFAGFSVVGAMVALAGQDVVKNLFGSITVFTDRPFRVGDSIKVEGIEGVVEDVGFRSTRLRSPLGSLITLPNSRLTTAAVDNIGVKQFRVFNKRLRVPWTTSPDRLEAFCEGVRELIRNHPYTRKEAFQVWVNDVNDFALEILIDVAWLVPDTNTELRERHRFLMDVHRLARDLEIQFAYPTQRVVMTADPDRESWDFSLDEQTRSTMRGRDASRALLKQSLPEERPDPASPGTGLIHLSDESESS